MVTVRGQRANYKRSISAASHSASKQQHKPPRVNPTSATPFEIPPRAASAKFEHIFMDHCEFRLSSVHGFGVFAIQDIQPGTMIMEEKALWVVDTLTAMKCTFSRTPDYGIPRHSIINAFYRSNSDEDEEDQVQLQTDILTLCGGFSNEEIFKGNKQDCMRTMSEHLREIIILNGVAESADGKPEYAAVFRASSRMNHSCVPNAERMRSKVDNDDVVSQTSYIRASTHLLTLIF
jgi:hypothetical protein